MTSLNFGGEKNCADPVYVSDVPVKGRSSEFSVLCTVGENVQLLDSMPWYEYHLSLPWQHTETSSFKEKAWPHVQSHRRATQMSALSGFDIIMDSCCCNLFFNMQNLKTFSISSQFLFRHSQKGFFLPPGCFACVMDGWPVGISQR